MKCNQCAKSFIIYANNSCHANATFDCCCHQDMAVNVHSKHRWNWTKFHFSFIKHKRNFKHLMKFRNTQRNFPWNFVSPNEISLKISRNVSHNQAKFRTCQDNSALPNFFSKLQRTFVSFEISLVFTYIRRNSSKFALNTFTLYCIIVLGPLHTYIHFIKTPFTWLSSFIKIKIQI